MKMIEDMNKSMEKVETGRHFVVGDTHGCGKTVENLMKAINFDERKDHVYFLGDYYGALGEDDHVNLLMYINQYYQPDITQPGFHLLRGNHDWWNKYTTFLNDVWGNIKIAKLPDIVVLKINNKIFALSHCGMHREIWNEIKVDFKDCISAYQLDTSWREEKAFYRKYYEAVIFTPKNGYITYYDDSNNKSAEYWLKEIDNTYFIHGHFPITLERDMKKNYNYIPIGKTGVRYNEVRNAYNIDAGIKSHVESRKLSCICLEELEVMGGENAIHTTKYEKGLAEIKINPEYIDVRYTNKKICVENEKLTIKKYESFSDLTIEDRLEKIKEKVFSEYNNEFINAMYTLATIKLDDLDKGVVEDPIKNIKKYVSGNASVNNKVNTMFGFNDSDFLIPTFGTKGYYFFIADIKIKSIVYLLRIYNFIENWDKSNTIEKQKEDFFILVQNTKINSVRKFFKLATHSEDFTFKQIIEEGREFKGTETKNDEYEKFCNNVIDFLKAEDDISKNDKLNEICKIYNNSINEIEDDTILENIPSFQSGKLIFNSTNVTNNLEQEYYLFDNSMKEINFVGIQWKWLWRYERNQEDLFRCVGTDDFTYHGEYNGLCNESSSGRKYYQTMIKNIVEHMNKGNDKSKLASYSKNPFRDIYKYMNIKNEEEANSSNNEEYFFIVKKVSDTNSITYKAELKYGSGLKNKKEDLLGEKDEKSKLPYENNKNTVTFAMIKQANTNIVKKLIPVEEGKEDFKIKKIIDTVISEELYKVNDQGKDIKSFFELIKRESVKDSEYGFCVDILNNKALYTGDVRAVFQKYVSQFPDVDIQGLQRNIVAIGDEEVVMLGNTCKAISNWEDNKEVNYDSCEPNHEYRLTLTAKEMLYLFYRMYKIRSDKPIRINIKECTDDVPEGYKKYEIKETKINETKIYAYVEDVFGGEKSEPSNGDINNQQKKTTDEKKYKDIVQDAIKVSLTHILESCEGDTKDKVEFICSFLESSSYKQSPRYGNKVYGEKKAEFKRDQFIEFCRNLLLK